MAQNGESTSGSSSRFIRQNLRRLLGCVGLIGFLQFKIGWCFKGLEDPFCYLQWCLPLRAKNLDYLYCLIRGSVKGPLWPWDPINAPLTSQQIPLTLLKSLNVIDPLGLLRSCSVHDNHICMVIKSCIKIKDQIVDLSRPCSLVSSKWPEQEFLAGQTLGWRPAEYRSPPQSSARSKDSSGCSLSPTPVRKFMVKPFHNS